MDFDDNHGDLDNYSLVLRMSTNGDDGQPDKADQGEEDWVPDEDQEPDRSITWSKGYPIGRLTALLASRFGIGKMRAVYLAERIIDKSAHTLRHDDNKPESIRFVVNYNGKEGSNFLVFVRFGKLDEVEEKGNNKVGSDRLPADSVVYFSPPENRQGRPRGVSGKVKARKIRRVSGRYSTNARKNMKMGGRSRRS